MRILIPKPLLRRYDVIKMATNVSESLAFRYGLSEIIDDIWKDLSEIDEECRKTMERDIDDDSEKE